MATKLTPQEYTALLALAHNVEAAPAAQKTTEPFVEPFMHIIECETMASWRPAGVRLPRHDPLHFTISARGRDALRKAGGL